MGVAGQWLALVPTSDGFNIPLSSVTIAVVMTVGIAASLFLAPLIGKRVSNSVDKIRQKDTKWGEIFMTSLFMGMISAFLGLIICNLGFIQTDSGVIFNLASKDFIPLIVLFVSAVVMVVCGLLMKLPKMKWLSEYALPISLILGMAAAIPLTLWLS